MEILPITENDAPLDFAKATTSSLDLGSCAPKSLQGNAITSRPEEEYFE
eukprot:CAMPEP_0114429198 /NCGR_PEP_ID=MMETSP0103-20121206/9346_1 /TAXON_ID=37642 ORGANISM="Paraphysomonas imperforata, Strain PA2" /NCGR_SAMPLE_ID=MMETSP0103 /ASSEMBLY_ACC=CAM_ASM_000201 /LENGTH=48 /DNA_ID= /DNA_START= /DNA_END= /DNA_ORIENTATION=